MVFGDTSRPRVKGVDGGKVKLEMNDLYARIVSDEKSRALALDLLSKYGYDNSAVTIGGKRRSLTDTELAHKLAAIAMNAGEQMFKDLADIHPDKDLIMHFCAPEQKEPETIIKEVIREVPAPAAPLKKDEGVFEHDCGCGGKHLHDCGCGGGHKEGEHYSAEGGRYPIHRGKYRYDTGGTSESDNKDKYLKPALLVSFTALACFVIWKL